MKSRNILVSGGTSGIGFETALRFAESGEAVTILARDVNRMEAALGELRRSNPSGRICGIVCDISDPEAIESLPRRLTEEGVPDIDVLINNAGVRMDRPPDSAPSESYFEFARAVLDTNVIGALMLTRICEPLLRSPGGRIVYVASVAAISGSGTDAYAASKGAMVSLTYSHARRLSIRGITVNAVLPGFIPATGMFTGRRDQVREDQEQAKTLTGRNGTTADIARAISYLAHRDSSYITGEIHHVNGGSEFGR